MDSLGDRMTTFLGTLSPTLPATFDCVNHQNAGNRQLRITYPSTATSKFTYDALGHTVKIVESTGSTKQFIWCGSKMCEARDGSGTLLNQYFRYGQTISGSNYVYSTDQLGSVREMTDTSGNIQAQYTYDPYGRVTQLQGSLTSDFQYAGYYFHAPSGLNLAVHRAYNATFGRWISRDPIKESGGVNLYAYVRNNVVEFTDYMGLFNYSCPLVPPDPRTPFKKPFPYVLPGLFPRNIFQPSPWQLSIGGFPPVDPPPYPDDPFSPIHTPYGIYSPFVGDPGGYIFYPNPYYVPSPTPPPDNPPTTTPPPDNPLAPITL
jgi:RHS repeat-associated protein